MPNCSRCKCSLPGNAVICGPCFTAWPKGQDSSEYLSILYNPEPVIIPMGFGTADDYPI